MGSRARGATLYTLLFSFPHLPLPFCSSLFVSVIFVILLGIIGRPFKVLVYLKMQYDGHWPVNLSAHNQGCRGSKL